MDSSDLRYKTTGKSKKTKRNPQKQSAIISLSTQERLQILANMIIDKIMEKQNVPPLEAKAEQ